MVVQIAFLPLGADSNSAVYRAVTADHTLYFVKLRRGIFDQTSVELPRFLSDQGIAQIIPPLATKTGQLWAMLDAFTVIVHPFIEGRNGFEVALTDRQWHDFGVALKRLHTAAVPPEITRRIQREQFAPRYRESVKLFLSGLDGNPLDDAVARQLTAFLKTKRDAVRDLVERAERLALALQANTPEFVVCHFDIHAGNLLIEDDHKFYIVDWDDPLLAPKERDLMFIGGAQGFVGYTAQEEEALFYRGYGDTQIDPVALAYYRYERIIVDIAIYCEELLLTTEGGDDRERSLGYLMSNFLPNSTIEVAYNSDRTPSGA
ncbi:MAG TPA: phosphotransferase [Roseiflexaceae bacterium]|nr:phosphotransferase [Roseiflexaceae bacterium]